MAGGSRDLALFDLGIDSKLRGCDLVKLRVRDVCLGDQIAPRAIIMQQKTQQCYAFIYCLDSEIDTYDQQRIDGAFAVYPWRGGYSYVNIYFVLQNQVPWRFRPTIKAIQKASPGWLDLFLNADVAIQIAKSVAALAGAGVVAVKSYAAIKKALSQIDVERERAKLQTFKISVQQQKTLMSMCEGLAKHLGFKSVQELHQRTGSPEISLKLLSAHYRRTKVLLEYVEEGKVTLPDHTDA